MNPDTTSHFRRVLGLFATGVTVVTTVDDEQLYGMTVNSFTSLSLDPMLVLICIDKRSSSHDAIARSQRFCVSILAQDQEMVSTIFAGAPTAERFDTVKTVRSGGGLPVVENSLGYVEVRVTGTADGGDHTIFIGEITDLAVFRDDTGPLAYYRGRYAALAPHHRS